MTTHDVQIHQQLHHEIEVPVLNLVGLVPVHHQIHQPQDHPQIIISTETATLATEQPQPQQQQPQQPPPQQHNQQQHNQQQHNQQQHNQQQHNQQQQQNLAPPPAPADDKKPKNDKKKKEAIDGQAREIIFKVIKFFESEKHNRGYAFPVENVVKRACAATGLSESTIKRIKRDGLRAEATQTKMTGPKKKRIRKTKVQLDYFQLCALRGIVNSYAVRKEVPTLGKILAAARHELNYQGGKESLRLILLNKLGIKFKKCEKKNKKPPEQNPPPPAMQPVPNTMPHPQMQHMKPLDNQCVYTTLMPQVPVSY